MDIDLKDRQVKMEALVKSPAWVKYFVPWIEQQISKNRDIKAIKEDSNGTVEENNNIILREFRKRKAKIEVYKSVINFPQNCIDGVNNG